MNNVALYSVIGVVVVIAIIIIICSSLYFYRMAVARVSKAFLNEDPGLKLNPDVEFDPHAAKRWWNEQPFEIWTQTSQDGLKLNAYYLAAAEPTAGTVILAHGYSADASIMSTFAKLYHVKYGMNVLLPDARGHGTSEGSYIGFGWHERLDYLDWIDLVIEHAGPQSNIMLHGVSMGASTVMMTSGEELPDQVRCIIADCGYTSVQDELAYQLKRMYHLPSFPILQATSLLTQLRAGYSFAEASALKQLQKNTKPILFIHGEKDTFVPTAMVYQLYNSTHSAKELLIVPGAGHGEAYRTDPASYEQALSSFIDTYIDC